VATLWQQSASRLGRQSKENHMARREYPGVYPYASVDGRTLYRALYRDSNGGQRQKRGFTSPSAAAKFRTRLQVRAERGELRITRETFAEHFDGWLKSHHRASKGTRDGYRAAGERRLKPFFGPMRLSAIEVQTVRNFAAQMVELVEAGELAPKTVNNTLSCLSTCRSCSRRTMHRRSHRPKTAERVRNHQQVEKDSLQSLFFLWPFSLSAGREGRNFGSGDL
jgi:hypothetical protein